MNFIQDSKKIDKYVFETKIRLFLKLKRSLKSLIYDLSRIMSHICYLIFGKLHCSLFSLLSLFSLFSSSLIGFIAGYNRTSLMLFESVRNMVKRSIPMPKPPVGGRPYSNAVQKFSSTAWASSSPAALACFNTI